ncbi:hypothetical protein ACFC58_06630 [Kitasatospora purpeofusca]|uniref:hypothetical protein n=1 Tax=Kitasatospora purpeofusca TaxID=67352 RepID=UPI0035DBD5D5
MRWFVMLGTGAPQDVAMDAKLAAEMKGLPWGYQQALRAIEARLALDPVGERPAEPHDPERVRISRLSTDDEGALVVATGATASVIARVFRPKGAVGVVRVIRVIPGP